MDQLQGNRTPSGLPDGEVAANPPSIPQAASTSTSPMNDNSLSLEARLLAQLQALNLSKSQMGQRSPHLSPAVTLPQPQIHSSLPTNVVTAAPYIPQPQLNLPYPVGTVPQMDPLTAVQILQANGLSHLAQRRGLPSPFAAGVPMRRSAMNVRNEEKVRRTIYITDLDPQVGEEQLVSLFRDYAPLVDWRVCGDPNSTMRFAFIEFGHETSAQLALLKTGIMLGNYPIRVSPSRTSIVPVNNQYLPRSAEEMAAVARTVYIANIDRVVERETVAEFFSRLCGPINKIRLLGDAQHNTKIAFIEFVNPDSAKLALKCSGALLGSLPLRVSPSKTPVRSDASKRHQPVQLANNGQVLLNTMSSLLTDTSFSSSSTTS